MLTKRTERCAVARRGELGGRHAAQHLRNIEMAYRRLCPPYGSMSAPEESQPVIGTAGRDLENFCAHHIMGHKRIVVHPDLKIRQGRVVRQNPAAQFWLKAAGQQEDALIESTLDP